MKTRIKRLWLLLAGTLCFASCAPSTGVSVDSMFMGERVKTTVDSDIAKYYLENYLQKKPGNVETDQRIKSLYRKHARGLSSREELKKMSQDFSVDFAALFFADQLLKKEDNRRLNQSFSYLMKNPKSRILNASQYVILFVPGWDYVKNGHESGADLKTQRELATQQGIENRLVRVPSTGGVEENAQFLAEAIREQSKSGKKIILAGASSAGPAIHLALGEKLTGKTLKSVKAWLNLAGILQGSPLVEHIQKRPKNLLFNFAIWMNGWDKKAINSMGTQVSRNRFKRLIKKHDILVINYVGVPLSGQLSEYSQKRYQILAPEGPNDGLTLLSDVLAPNSTTIVSFGSDHFFAEDPEIDRKSVAMMKLVISRLEERRRSAR